MDLIRTCALAELIHAMEGEQPTLKIERVIDMQQAVLALDCGIPMATIVRDVSEQLEQHVIQRVLMLTQGNKAEAARRLRIDYKTWDRLTNPNLEFTLFTDRSLSFNTATRLLLLDLQALAALERA